MIDTTKLHLNRTYVDGDIVTETIRTDLGDISGGTATAAATNVESGEATELPTSNLTVEGTVDVDMTPILTGNAAIDRFFVLEVEVILGGIVRTVPSVEGRGTYIKVRPDRITGTNHPDA